MAQEIKVDMEKLTEMCISVYSAFKNRTGVFKSDFKNFLPQYNIPQEFEYNPWRIETKMPGDAANYLFLMASLEKQTLTRTNIKKSLETWAEEDKRWIFRPEEVAQRSDKEVFDVCKKSLGYVLGNFPINYKNNATTIAEKYGGDARNIMDTLSVEESRRRLMEFRGIGSGIANLFMIYLLERKIASVTDPENVLLKVDVHKGRLPLNTDCVTLVKAGEVRRDLLVPILESAYWKVCKENNFDPVILDAALWIVGSGVCVKRDYFSCVESCPIEDMCVSCVPENKINGRFQISQNGKRVETRKNLALKNQEELPLSFE